MIDFDQAPVAPRGTLASQIPVIDLSASPATIVDDIGGACREWGFFQIVGHGVPGQAIADLLDVTRSFFALPVEQRRRLLRTRDNPWGYYDRELTKEQRDKKAVFDVGPDAGDISPSPRAPFAGTTRWPPSPPAFQAAMRNYFGEMTRVASQLIGLIGASLTGDPNRLRAAFEPDHTSFVRLNHYPVDDPLEGEDGHAAGLGVHHHSDAGALTLLLQNGVGGLQVYRDSYWHDVPACPGGFTVNIGDMVQLWSNDLYPAPLHRVLAMREQERFSIPYFYNPSYDAVIAPLESDPHYAPVPWGDFRRRRADGDFADYGTEVQIADYRR